jgi:hypothetical protein
LEQSRVTVGGNNTEARNLLVQALDGTRRLLHWRLLFDPINRNTFVLNIAVAEKAFYDGYGRKRLLPLDYPSVRPR